MAVIEYIPKRCCNGFMNLITSYYVDGENDNTYFIFQCKKCGKIIDYCALDLEEFAEDKDSDEKEKTE